MITLGTVYVVHLGYIAHVHATYSRRIFSFQTFYVVPFSHIRNIQEKKKKKKAITVLKLSIKYINIVEYVPSTQSIEYYNKVKSTPYINK